MSTDASLADNVSVPEILTKELNSENIDLKMIPREFKLKVSNVPRFLNPKSVREELSGLLGEIEFVVKKSLNGNQAFLIFKSEDDRQTGFDKIDGFELKKEKLEAELVENEENRAPKKMKTEVDSSLPLEERLQDQVTPLWRYPYDRQVILKKRRMRKVIDKYRKDIVEAPFLNFDDSRSMLDEFINGYRNKCEFAIGLDEDGNVCVGFSMGAYKDGLFQTAGPQSCLHVSNVMKDFVSKFQTFVSSSGLPVFDRINQTGFWRLLTLRQFSTNELMVLVQANKGYETDIESLKQKLIELCASYEYEEFKVASFTMAILGSSGLCRRSLGALRTFATANLI